jgi:C_GCAxxG_C_C family probable redox protein
MVVNVRKEYQGLSREELLQKAYDLGVAYELNSFSCSQCTVAALYDMLDLPDATIVKLATSNVGGTTIALGTCGTIIGGIMVLDYFFGRPFEHMSKKEVIEDPNIMDLGAAVSVATPLVNRSAKEYGTITCANIQLQLYGRYFFPGDPDEFNKLVEAGAHSDPDKCARIVGNAAKWTLEILLDRGAVELGHR